MLGRTLKMVDRIEMTRAGPLWGDVGGDVLKFSRKVVMYVGNSGDERARWIRRL